MVILIGTLAIGGYIYKLDNDNGLYSFFCPLYDNGSSLCSYVNDENIKDILNDKKRYAALIDTKSKSCIGWKDERPIRHFKLIEKIRDNYYNGTIEFVQKINMQITKESIKEILNKFSSDIISDEKKKILLKFIIDRRNKIVEIYDINSEVIIDE